MRKRWAMFEIAERSMVPTLVPGDWVLGVRRGAEPGDIAVFDGPDGVVMVKRVVAGEGAEVSVCDGSIRVDGAEIPAVLDALGAGKWVIPEGHLFVLSDASDLTLADSRTFGPIKASSVRAVVRWRYAPVRRIGRVR